MKKGLINSFRHFSALTIAILLILIATSLSGFASAARGSSFQQIVYKTVKINGLDIFYREAGDPTKPTILLLHGFPASSFMFRNLIPQLADKFHVIAPDYPGYGYSSAPLVSEFDYTFDNLTNVVDKFINVVGLKKYSLYVQDYGAPVGYRLATKYPDKVQALIVQNGNAYEEGLRDFWNPIKNYWKNPSDENANKLREFLKLDATKWQYTHGTRNPQAISPDAYTFDQALLNRPGNQEIQLKPFLDYNSNPPLYASWQRYFRKYQPPTLIVWGKNDQIFSASGAESYKRDLKNIEFHLLDTGHFALEEDGDLIADYIRNFLAKQKIN